MRDPTDPTDAFRSTDTRQAGQPLRLDPMMQAAYLAGRSLTAEEIVARIGVGTPEAIAGALRLYNIRLDAKPFGQRIVMARLAREHHAVFDAAAKARGIDTAALVERVLAVIGRGEISIDGLLDDTAEGESR